MGKPIFFCEIYVSEIARRGKRETVVGSYRFKAPLIHTDPKSKPDNPGFYRTLIRMIFKKNSGSITSEQFIEKFRVEKIIKLKQIGNVADIPEYDGISDVNDDDDEWL